MYSLDITGLGGARIWITGIFVPGECPDLLRGGMGGGNWDRYHLLFGRLWNRGAGGWNLPGFIAREQKWLGLKGELSY